MEASQPTNDAANATIAAADAAESTDDLLRLVLQEQRQHRAEVATLREQINAEKARPAAPPSQPQTPEELNSARLEHVGQHDFYCPGCGLLYDYRQRCLGKPESPHPAIEVVSTDELKEGDPSKHTAPEYVTT